jgi:hypothetical protein
VSGAALATAAFSAALGGFAALGLAMERHFQDSFGRNTAPGHWLPWLRLGGVAGLALSLLTCLAVQGSTQGWVLWWGMLTVAAATVVSVLSYAPRWSLHIGLLGWAVAALALLVGWSSAA